MGAMLHGTRVAFAMLLMTACASRAPAPPAAPTPAEAEAAPAPVPVPEGVHGVLVLPPGVSEPAGGDVFVAVYGPDQERWRVIGTVLLPATAWPLPFDVGVEQRMIDGTPIAGKVRIRAWIDHDGDACTFQKGDREGVLETEAPATGLTIPLDQVHAVDVPNRCAT